MISRNFFDEMSEEQLLEFAEYAEKQPNKFVELFDENHPKQTYIKIRNEYTMDRTKLNIYSMLDSKKLLHFHTVHLIGKYCFFIIEFEKIEEYELCGQVREDLYDFINDEIGIERSLFDELFEDSITTYREMDELIEKGYDFEEEE